MKEPSYEPMKMLYLDNKTFKNAKEMQRFLAFKLDFPQHYGKNWAALNDCLSEVCYPTTIVIETPKGKRDEWFRKGCKVIKRAAKENPWLFYTEESKKKAKEEIARLRKESAERD